MRVLEVRNSGLQISLNYLMKFNAELAPNSSRDYLEGDGGMGGCDLPCTMTYVHIPGFCCFLACARRVALLFGGRISKVRPALRKAGRALFWRSNLRSATCLAQGGSRFGDQAPRVQKMLKNGSSQNDVLYSGKCSHTPGDYF